MYGALMIDVAGTQLTQEDVSILSQPEVGGIILFARNIDTPEQVRQLCDSIRRINANNLTDKLSSNPTPNPAPNPASSRHNMLIGVDQEGGRVARLRQGFTPLPAMGRLGDLFNHDPVKALALAYDCGYLMAVEVMAVGIDISFAPVLDINGLSQVIGDRSFHVRSEAIVAIASQFMRGMKTAGMATTGKHFPGHGSIAPDSHVADAIDNRSFDEIKSLDLQPFIQCLPWLDALMPAHVIFSQVDDKPAGFSKIWLQDIARQQLGFNGVLFSDDLSMKAAHVIGGVKERVKAALMAGCDMALVCNDRQAAQQALSATKECSSPNQSRLNAMFSHIPAWQGSLESTCEQFSYWREARHNIMQAFFDKAQQNTVSMKDPTSYSSIN